MNNELVVDETSTTTEGISPNSGESNGENSTESAPVVAALPENAGQDAGMVPKRRGRPPGSGRKANGEKPASTKKAPRARAATEQASAKPTAKAKKIASTDAAFAVLENLASDELAVAVHGASSTARLIIAQLLKAGI